MTPSLRAAIVIGLSSLLAFGLFLRAVTEHIGGPLRVVFGSWATAGSLLFVVLVIVGAVG
jgi:hypothetical protein